MLFRSAGVVRPGRPRQGRRAASARRYEERRRLLRAERRPDEAIAEGGEESQQPAPIVAKALEVRGHKIKEIMMAKGLYANIHAKRKRIKAGSKEKMRKPGSKGAPTAKAFKAAKKTAKKK